MHQTFVHNPAYPLPQELLPHRPPMMLISGIVNADESQLCAYAKIGEEHHLFLNEKKEASNALLLELMAQCVGCWAGLRERTLTGGKPRIGFLLGTRSFSCRARPLHEGETVQIKSRCLYLGDNVLPSQFECHALIGEEEAARATLTVYQPKDLSVFSK